MAQGLHWLLLQTLAVGELHIAALMQPSTDTH
jgi:hypothetical protein